MALIFVDCLLLFLLWLCLLVFSFASYFWWMGSHPWLLFTRFFFFFFPAISLCYKWQGKEHR
jgi:hypothetical protein